jgi:hypothetical protein
MKNTITVVLFLLCFLGVKAQISMPEVDSRIIELYGASRVQEMIANQPQMISYLNYYVQNAYQVVHEIPERKLSQFKDISEIHNLRTGVSISADDLDHLNVLLLDIQRKNDQYVTYKLGNTGSVVVFIAPQFLVSEYNARVKEEGKR